MHRSDYLLHAANGRIIPQQVELNTIAASFSSLSSLVSQLHRYTSERFGILDAAKIDAALPINPSMDAIPRALAAAHEAADLGPASIVIMVVQPGERNAFDQRHVEYTLRNRHNVRMRRYSLKQILEKGSLNDAKQLVVYVVLVDERSAYFPQEWRGRICCVLPRGLYADRLPDGRRVGRAAARRALGCRKVPQHCLPPHRYEKGAAGVCAARRR